MNGPSILADRMQDFLCETIELYLLAHFLHLNVVGANFSEYHNLFGMIYEDLQSSIDPIGENIRKLHALVDSQSMAPNGPSSVYPAETQGMVRFLLSRIDNYQSTIVKLLALADTANNQGLINYLADRQDKMSDFQWRLSSSSVFQITEV